MKYFSYLQLSGNLLLFFFSFFLFSRRGEEKLRRVTQSPPAVTPSQQLPCILLAGLCLTGSLLYAPTRTHTHWENLAPPPPPPSLSLSPSLSLTITVRSHHVSRENPGSHILLFHTTNFIFYWAHQNITFRLEKWHWMLIASAKHVWTAAAWTGL